MVKLFISTVALFLLIQVNAQKTIINDPNAQVREIGSFSAVSVSGSIDLYLRGNEDAVAVSASESSYRDRIKTSVQNGVLKIWYESKGLNYNSGNKKLKAYVSFNNISKLSASGACDVYVDGIIKGNELAIHLSGASDFRGKVELNKLSLNQTGASDATISGKVTTLHIEAVGASDLKGYDLETENCNITATGASDVKITVNKELVVKATGASSISYKGRGYVKEVRATGASSINKRS